MISVLNQSQEDLMNRVLSVGTVASDGLGEQQKGRPVLAVKLLDFRNLGASGWHR